MSFESDLVDEVSSKIDEWLLQPIDEFAGDIDNLQKALELLAGNLPDPPQELKRQVITVYDFQVALREYQKKQLLTLLKRRYVALWKAYKAIMTTSVLKSIAKQLLTLRFGAVFSFLLTNGLQIAVAAVAAEDLFNSLSVELLANVEKRTLKQTNPRHVKKGAHRTRKNG